MDRTSANKWFVWLTVLAETGMASMTAGCHRDDDADVNGEPDDPVTQEEALAVPMQFSLAQPLRRNE